MARIIVVGGSLGGLFAANLLHRDGHEVTLLEKSKAPLDGRGAGIVTHPPLLEALARAGAGADQALGVQVTQRVVLAQSGAVEALLDLPQILTSWGRLHQILVALLPAARYRLGFEVTGLTSSTSAVTVHCANGASLEADLLIASDGLRSSIRAHCAPEVEPCYAGYVAWRGVCDEAVLSTHTLASLFGYFGFCLPPGEQMLGYPVAGAANCVEPGERRYNFVWYRPAQEGPELRGLLTDDEGRLHAAGIPPNKVTQQNIEIMRTEARTLLAPQFVEILEKTAQPFLQPICDLSSERIAFGRIALMGDAAFVARPHVGMGVTKAAEDALTLAQCVTEHGANQEALLDYETRRLKVGQRVVERARQLGAYMQAQGRSHPDGVAVERDARQVLMDTAVDFRRPGSARQAAPGPA
jgi:2-polyprenyl-6-methoxyphenol hydroxylase-like FAD-dependent oxidoreductase